MPMTKVKVLTPILHDGLPFAPGKELELPNSDAEKLIRLGAVSTSSGRGRPRKDQKMNYADLEGPVFDAKKDNTRPSRK